MKRKFEEGQHLSIQKPTFYCVLLEKDVLQQAESNFVLVCENLLPPPRESTVKKLLQKDSDRFTFTGDSTAAEREFVVLKYHIVDKNGQISFSDPKNSRVFTAKDIICTREYYDSLERKRVTFGETQFSVDEDVLSILKSCWPDTPAIQKKIIDALVAEFIVNKKGIIANQERGPSTIPELAWKQIVFAAKEKQPPPPPPVVVKSQPVIDIVDSPPPVPAPEKPAFYYGQMICTHPKIYRTTRVWFHIILQGVRCDMPWKIESQGSEFKGYPVADEGRLLYTGSPTAKQYLSIQLEYISGGAKVIKGKPICVNSPRNLLENRNVTFRSTFVNGNHLIIPLFLSMPSSASIAQVNAHIKFVNNDEEKQFCCLTLHKAVGDTHYSPQQLLNVFPEMEQK